MADVDTKPGGAKPAAVAADAAPLPAQALGGTAIKPEGWDRTGWEAFKYTMYDPSAGTVLTRTPLSWLKITVFYCIYYSFLAGFWIACLNIFFCTLPDPIEGPRWKETNSLIGNNPGVGLRPRNNDKDIDSQMFVLKTGDDNLNPSERDGEGTINADYAARTAKFLELYDNTNMHHSAYKTFDPKVQLAECGQTPYGYVEINTTAVPPKLMPVAPCILVKLNTIWGWEPRPYIADKETPPTLKKHLDSDDGIKGNTNNNVWIDCNGRYPADREALEDGGLEYFPKSRALPIDYFPYKGKTKDSTGEVIKGYHPPLVAIKVNPKKRTLGQLIHIECRAYYDGVVQITKTREGLVQFEVQIKNDY